jgi:disulfide bond formation protein DsbB
MKYLAQPRWVFGFIFAACAALFGFGLYLQHAQALEPCPMCILQRYAFIAIGLVALVAAIDNPRGGWALRIYGGLVTLLAIAGGGVAARHSYLQHFPPLNQSCGADLSYLLELPMSRAWPAIFRGTGECSEVKWTTLGLSIPEWALVWFVIFAALAVLAVVKARRSDA